MPTQSADAAKPVIAVVDDDASFLRSVGRLLASSGYAVKLFGSAAEFLVSLPGSAPLCLVLDVHMPQMTGLELHDRLAAQGSCVPVIFVTAYDSPETPEHARRPGCIGLLLKPFDKRALLSAVGDALRWQPSRG